MKSLLTSAFLFLTILTATASDNQKLRTEASDISRRLANQIQLNESEYIQVKNYTLEKLEAVAEIKAMYNNDQEMMLRKLNEAEKDYNHKVTSLLNSTQLENFFVVYKSLKADITTIAVTQE